MPLFFPLRLLTYNSSLIIVFTIILAIDIGIYVWIHIHLHEDIYAFLNHVVYKCLFLFNCYFFWFQYVYSGMRCSFFHFYYSNCTRVIYQNECTFCKISQMPSKKMKNRWILLQVYSSQLDKQWTWSNLIYCRVHIHTHFRNSDNSTIPLVKYGYSTVALLINNYGLLIIWLDVLTKIEEEHIWQDAYDW